MKKPQPPPGKGSVQPGISIGTYLLHLVGCMVQICIDLGGVRPPGANRSIPITFKKSNKTPSPVLTVSLIFKFALTNVLVTWIG